MAPSSLQYGSFTKHSVPSIRVDPQWSRCPVSESYLAMRSPFIHSAISSTIAHAFGAQRCFTVHAGRFLIQSKRSQFGR